MSAPRCPNHGCELLLTSEQRTQTSGISPCPESNCPFAWTQEVRTHEQEMKVDKFGNPVKDVTWKVEGVDGQPQER